MIEKQVDQECMKIAGQELIDLVRGEQLFLADILRWSIVVADIDANPKEQYKLRRNIISASLYRGQSKLFTPCFSALCRGFDSHAYRISDLAPIDQARLLHRLARNKWFADEVAIIL